MLVGDALRTARVSIGWGTRTAPEDAIALDRALARHPTTISAALSDYETFRRPIVEMLVTVAHRSAAWCENFAHRMSLDPMDFTMGYRSRSGRMDGERLHATSPRFVRASEATTAWRVRLSAPVTQRRSTLPRKRPAPTGPRSRCCPNGMLAATRRGREYRVGSILLTAGWRRWRPQSLPTCQARRNSRILVAKIKERGIARRAGRTMACVRRLRGPHLEAAEALDASTEARWN